MKAIETEYKNQISLEIPDLWSRIEAGVDEYEKNKVNNTVSSVDTKAVETITDTQSEDKTDEKVININRTKKIIPILGRIAVAAACIALASTVVTNFGNRSKNESATATMDSAAADESPSMATDSAMDSAAETAEPDYYMEESENCMEEAAEVNSEETKAAEDSSATENAEAEEELPYDNDSILDITTILDGNIYSAIDVADQMVAGGIPSIMTVSLVEDEPVVSEFQWLMEVTDRDGNIYLVTVIHENDEMYVTQIQKDSKTGEVIFEAQMP